MFTGRFFKSIHLFVYRENTPGSNDIGEVHIVQKEHVNMEGEEALSIGVGKAVFLLSPLKYVDQQHKKGKKESMEKMGWTLVNDDSINSDKIIDAYHVVVENLNKTLKKEVRKKKQVEEWETLLQRKRLA